MTSDTHGNYPLLFHACELAAPFDAVIHLGDGGDDADLIARVLGINVISVAGNCDLGSPAPRERIWECEGQRLLLTHGDRFGVKFGLSQLEQRGIEVGAHAVLFGHSHLATITTLSGILYVNPGTLIKTATQRTIALLEVKQTGITAHLTHII
ncbi:MAG: YfcE family phosphodiesterase [Desulfuromonadales bacterium]|nr:YfcE family phosphodiesterase [Desulfuromonadales bacterium]